MSTEVRGFYAMISNYTHKLQAHPTPLKSKSTFTDIIKSKK